MTKISKRRGAPLALLGGQPAFDRILHVGAPNIGDRERLLARIGEVLDSRWLTNRGQMVQAFEQALAARLGVRHCVTVCNGTVALEVLMRALGLAGEVIVPSFTFIATAHAARWLGLTPVFADIDPATHCLTPATVEPLIGERTAAILPVHLWGHPCDVEGLQALADRHGLPLIFDAAHAFGCSAGGRMIGGFGRAEVFSFHATKFFNTFEGGAIATDDDALAERLQLMIRFGFRGQDNVVALGTNGKMSEVCAAMGLTGLESLEGFVETNRRHWEAYREGLAGIEGLRLFAFPEGERANWQYVVVEVDAARFGLTRDQLQRVLWAENVRARRYFHPGCHRSEPHASEPLRQPLPVTERVSESVLCLPTGCAVSLDMVNRVCDVIRMAQAHVPEIRARLSADAEMLR